jgi:Flp pilus assembly protein TadD
MARVEKAVFISYRRTNVPWGLAIFQNLTQHGCDVFFDFQGIASGDFEGVILENIKARAHFLVLLTPSPLERCGEPGDWFRREIETALDTQRNIVPLVLEGFDFSWPTISSQLTGKLEALKRYNALRVPFDYFDEAMNRLREKYLNVPLDMVLHVASKSAQQAASNAQAAASIAPAVQEHELTALKWFEQGLDAADLDERLRCYSQAIRLDPEDFVFYVHRGDTRRKKGDLDGALQDFGEAIRLKPDDARFYKNRGAVSATKGDVDGALRDYDKVIRLKPDYVAAYHNRGVVRSDNGDVDGALQDYSEAIRLKPDECPSYLNRSKILEARGDYRGALADLQKYLEMDCGVRIGNQAPVEQTLRDLVKKL